jgi:hypothetical protein
MLKPLQAKHKTVIITASIPLRCASSLSTSSKAKDTGPIANCSKNQEKE